MSHGPHGPEPTWPTYPLAPPLLRPVVAPHHPQAVTALVLGLLSLAVCQVLGVAAVVVGLTVQRDCDVVPDRWGGRGCGTAGFVLGLVALSVSACWALVLVVLPLATGR